MFYSHRGGEVSPGALSSALSLHSEFSPGSVGTLVAIAVELLFCVVSLATLRLHSTPLSQTRNYLTSPKSGLLKYISFLHFISF